MKNWNDRITQTIAFIRVAAVPLHGNLRERIADVIQSKYRPHIAMATSVAMSQGNYASIFNRDAQRLNRKYRRAMILIRVTFLGQMAGPAAANVGAVADLNLPAGLDALLLQANQHEEQLLQNEITALRANPAVFLAAKKIQVETSPASGTMNYIFYCNIQGQRFEFKRTTNIVANEVVINGFRVCYITISVHHVHVQGYNTVQANLGAIVGTAAAGGDSLMITTQLSGCSVVYQIQGADLVAAHIQPQGVVGGPGRGYNLAVTLRGAAGLANPILGGPAIEVFGCQAVSAGPQDYVPTRHTYWIGVKVGLNWQVHAQQHNIGLPADIPGTWQVA